MDRLLILDQQQFTARMREEFERLMVQVAEAVNAAPTGNVISGSEMAVRDLMDEFRRKTFESAVQMRIDSTESSFSPSQGPDRRGKAGKGTVCQDHAKRLRQDRAAAASLRDQGSGQRNADRSTGG